MIDKLKNSWTLVKASAGVLQKDRELLIFPIISSIGLLIISAIFFVPLLFGNLLDALFSSESGIFGYILLFFFYLVQYIVIFFANTALVGAAQIRLRGGDPTVSDGFHIATNHLGTIIGYAFIAATVGLILKIFSDKSKGVGRFVISLIGFAWNVATFLVVPILVTENVGPIEAIKRSAALLKKTWGEQIIGNFGLGAVFNLIYFLLFFVGIGLTAAVGYATESVWAAVPMGVIFILVFALVSLVNSALSGIYTAAVYEYASNGRSSGFFDESMVRNAFKSSEK
jgi:hypothetical protein